MVMYLWNFGMVPVFDINPLNYWQAMALLVLSKILLGGFHWRPRGGRNRFRRKWGKMNQEERHKLKEEWKRRCQKESEEDN